jgi:hypothetical protein
MIAKAGHPGDAHYFLVQYMPEPFRKEGTNVGVIATIEDRISARFFAEPMNDGKVLIAMAKRRVRYPKIYRQWVRFWRREISRGHDGLEDIRNEPQVNFRIIDGGCAVDTGTDRIDEIADNLYAQLVDARLDRRPVELHRHSKRLEASIRGTMMGMGLLSEGLGMKHPVVAAGSIDGECTDHRPSFVQQNSRPYVMQALGFSFSDSPKRISERSSATAFMFSDIKKAHDAAVRISIVQFSDDADFSASERASKILTSASEIVVHWDSDLERKQFLDERIEIAHSGQ